MNDTKPDTPETVAEKMKGVRSVMGAFVHYVGENHLGDWLDCRCFEVEVDGNE